MRQPVSFPAVLRDRRFSLLVSGQFVSALGDGMFPIAVSVQLLADGRPGAIATILAARAIGSLTGIMAAGAIVDRFARSRVMWVADVLRLVAVVVLIEAVTAGNLLLAHLGMAVLGLATSFFIPAFRAIIPRIVPADDVQQANALNSAILQTATVGGPALGGALLILGSPETIMWLNALSFGLSVLTLLLLPEPAGAPADRGDSVLTRAVGGLAAVRRIRWLSVLLITGILQMALTVAPWFTFLPILSAETYGSTGPYAASMTAHAIGGVFGAFLAAKATPRLPGAAAVLGPCLFSGMLLCLAWGAPATVLVVAHLIAGAGLQYSGVLQMTAIHQQVPDHLMGRVMSLTMLGGALLTPVSYCVLGPLSHSVGARPVLVTGAGLALVVLLLPLLLPDFRHLSDARRLKIG
ncbi:MFS transporter [Kitasatospora cineracea]|uniref:MFS transporter n=1 Tax=Kitasatospora cineracea TaxID=88074 RepID=UPI00380BB708